MGNRPAPRGTGQPARRPHPDRRQLGQPHPPRLDHLHRRTDKPRGYPPAAREVSLFGWRAGGGLCTSTVRSPRPRSLSNSNSLCGWKLASITMSPARAASVNSSSNDAAPSRSDHASSISPSPGTNRASCSVSLTRSFVTSEYPRSAQCHARFRGIGDCRTRQSLPLHQSPSPQPWPAAAHRQSQYLKWRSDRLRQLESPRSGDDGSPPSSRGWTKVANQRKARS
jgi:hypothetical protein